MLSGNVGLCGLCWSARFAVCTVGGNCRSLLTPLSPGCRRRLASAQRVPVFHRSTLERGLGEKEERKPVLHQPEVQTMLSGYFYQHQKKCKFAISRSDTTFSVPSALVSTLKWSIFGSACHSSNRFIFSGKKSSKCRRVSTLKLGCKQRLTFF